MSIFRPRDPQALRRHSNARALVALDALDTDLPQGIARLQSRLNAALARSDLWAVHQARLDLEELLSEAQVTLELRRRAAALLGQMGELPEREAPLSATPAPAPAGPAASGRGMAEPAPAPGAETATGSAPTPEMHVYWASSAILARAYALVTRPGPRRGLEPEWMLAVSGLQIGPARTLEQLIAVKLANQSVASAAFDMADFRRVSHQLYDHGQALHAIFHSHPSRGHPHPSGVDRQLQSVLEEGGYPLIQAVFSRDGYVRFFANRRPFSIQIYGKGVEHVDPEERLFRVVQPCSLSDTNPAP